MKKYLQKLDILGLLLLVAGFIWYSVSNVWEIWDLVLVIAGGALAIVGIAANYKQILASLGKRSTKYAGNYVISLILVIAIVAGLNYIGQRHVKRFDTTHIGRFTLASQTTQVLTKLNKDVEIKAFFPDGDYPPLKELLIEYKTTNSHVHYEFIDPNRKPDVAKQYEVTLCDTIENPMTGSKLKVGTVIVLYQGRKEKIEKRSEEVQEQDLTNAIIKAGRSETKKIYFIEGHEEKDPSSPDTERTGYSIAKKALEEQGYKVEIVNLASEGKVPNDAKVLIEAGPRNDPFPQELQFVNDFLNSGKGSLLAMVDPSAPSLQSFFKEWGVQVDNDLVLDVSDFGRMFSASESIPLVRRYENHKITERFRAMTFFPLTRSIQPDKTPPGGITVEPLFKSDANSWGETNLKKSPASFDQGQDLKGPLPLAVAVTKEIKPASETSSALKARMVVVGTSNFPVNSYFENQGNGNLFLNMVSWLAQDEDLISIRPKPREDRRIMMSPGQLSLLRLFVILVLPGIVLVIGIVVFVNRRRK
jgi:ABC-type uncharacterized transport system involved in gliding motility auxiliary subunit